jgi:hypothetical protein
MKYRYKAFISYRHVDRDRQWAKWLLEKLETYRTPKALRIQGVPERVGIIFRDDEEIPASADLSDQITDALKDSEFLVVICSPDTPHSKWVRREIEIFQSLGRGDNIIPLLVEGEPEQSFPPELFHAVRKSQNPDGSWQEIIEEQEPIAADVRPRHDEKHTATKHRAFVRIAAALMKCRFDDLAQRDKERQKRKHHAVIGLLAVLLMILAGSGLYWWDDNRIKTAYYVDYGERWLVPFGIHALTEKQASQRTSYRIQTRHGQVVNMQQLVGLQKPVELGGDGVISETWLAGVAQWNLSYDSNGELINGELRSPTGKLLLRQDIEIADNHTSAVVTFKQGKKGENSSLLHLTASFSLLNGFSSENSQKSNITQHKIYFTPEGFIDQILFQTPNATPAADMENNFGRSYEYANNGQVINQFNIDSNRERFSNGWKIFNIQKHYSSSGELVEVDWLDQNQKPVLGHTNHAKTLFAYNNQGIPTAIEFSVFMF